MPSVGLTKRIRARERVVVQVDSLALRCIGAAALVCASVWLVVVLTGNHRDGQFGGRLAWSLTVLAAVALIARGIFLGRPVTVMHAVAATSVLLGGLFAHLLGFALPGGVLIASSGLVLMWPTAARPRPDELPKVWALIEATKQDPLAPFAMQTGKCYLFDETGTAALAYRTRLGFAVVSGDPIGAEERFPALVADFAALCHSRGWRIAVLACSDRSLSLWRDADTIGQSLTAVPFGRDVVIDVEDFEMSGRRFRNLRQAVRHTHNRGITTEVVDEQSLTDAQRAELAEMLRASPKGAHTDRGFCMSLDGVLEGRYPGVQLIIARDAAGRVQGFDRFTTAGSGSDISLDVPWRRRDAPNGIDERLTVDMIAAARKAGAQRLSLAFAAFPELFGEHPRGLLRVCYRLVHILDPLISLESLYRYLQKYHAMDARRYVLISLTQLVPLLVVLLSLEFMPRRRRL
ncbi:hypothetical protein Mkiyose1665_44230 [Mycobacterium kiyosense]|uniref:Phosphatidylglycerol lysyltransferase C-terminal domain-containing protein n=1 Tax=Mycobacterium kiyosense TaxID=2871094 RepID=A0A9P3UYZ2_9MYCO|nr:hypothetical protein IWGMT90018_33280 [Mycobacterium kiyosense]BDE13884.1 hypothetical protein MKCMC460_27440 [Mycobacterium sp. 20KCMC460]GLB83773.1 hypothetical protein SRL2020028_30290 [Mycobacterium kiyosense]GLB91344.1 hypothetical protein SRL2020130_41610 [Mycobacterium kiyosense]GLB97219.1 hypothetical protein SRL2020226_39950 [Mycobacterium kiyosense]